MSQPVKIKDYDLDTLMHVLKSVWHGKQPRGSIYDIGEIREVREDEIIVDVTVSAPHYGKVLGGPLPMIGSVTFTIDGDSIKPSLALAYQKKD